MYGTSGKRGGGGGGGGRGGGGGAKRIRSPFPPQAPHRPVGGTQINNNNNPGRLSTGGGAASRNIHPSSGAPSPAPPAQEETYRLVSNDPLSYAMIIRLTPDLVDEIKRVEAQGGTAQIKFDSTSNNPSGNIIDVGGKDFRFTWSRELGELCDIYEERQSGEDGSGLLVESGCPWRKLNVQRILDESTKNHVKMRSEEAERISKSRKAIILDNPSGKNQMKSSAAAAVDGNTRRMPFKSKKEPPLKKQKVEPNQYAIGGPPKSVSKSGLSSAATAKFPPSVSPLPSPPEQPVPVASPFRSGNITRTTVSADTLQTTNKENTTNARKETPSKTSCGVELEGLGIKRGVGTTPKNLQSMLITLLVENPTGMSLQALEKAIGDTIPNSARKIELIEKIANLQASGRYFLKPGLESQSSKIPSTESGSSPEYTHDQTPAQESTFLDNATGEKFEPQTGLNSRQEENVNTVEKIDIQQNSPDLFGDKKVSDNSEGHAASSSDSGSDSESESDSSDSGSDSGSPSRSRSPAGSGSSSDSDTDDSTSSKEGSDVDVTGDDDKEEIANKLPKHDIRISSSPILLRTPDGGSLQNGFNADKQDNRVSDAGDLPNDEEEIDVDIIDPIPEKSNMASTEEKISLLPDGNQLQENQQVPSVRSIGNDSQHVKNQFEQTPKSERVSKAKHKKGPDLSYTGEKSENVKRLKAGNSTQSQYSGRSKETSYPGDSNHVSYGMLDDDSNRNPTVHMTDKVARAVPGASVSDAQWSGQRSGDFSIRGKSLDMDRPSRYAENLGRGIEHSERSPNVPDKSDISASRNIKAHEKFSLVKDKHRDVQDEDGYAYDKSTAKEVRGGNAGDRQSLFSDSHLRRNGEQIGKPKDVRQTLPTQTGSFPLDSSKTGGNKSPLLNGKGKYLRREVSELELGELREPFGEDTQGVKKQIDKSNSFKMSKNKSRTSDNADPVLAKGRTVVKSIQESRKQSSPNSRGGLISNQDALLRKRTPEDHSEESSVRTQQRTVLSQAHQMPKADRIDSEVGSQLNRSADIGSKSRKNGTRTNVGSFQEDNGDTHKRAPGSPLRQPHIEHAEKPLVFNAIKETKHQKSNTMTDLNGRRKDTSMDSNNRDRKRREASSDDENCSYGKYEKDEPELKGPIKDFQQYQEYVQEYNEKYDGYHSLLKNLDSYRKNFEKLGEDLHYAKDRDMERYYNIREHMKESYRQCASKHKRMKKIFVVLHDELKHLKQRINEFAFIYTRD